jgi:hypothetical protein
VRRAIDEAVRSGRCSLLGSAGDHLDSNPATAAGSNPMPAPRTVHAFSNAEIDAICAELGPREDAIVRFAAATGLPPRVGEARTAGPRGSNPRRLGPRHEDEAVPSRRAAVSAGARRARDRNDEVRHDPRLRRQERRRLEPRELAHLVPSIDRAGVARPARIYDLRSTFASNPLSVKVEPFELARIMGTSIEIIERPYGTLVAAGGASQTTSRAKSAQTRIAKRSGRRGSNPRPLGLGSHASRGDARRRTATNVVICREFCCARRREPAWLRERVSGRLAQDWPTPVSRPRSLRPRHRAGRPPPLTVIILRNRMRFDPQTPGGGMYRKVTIFVAVAIALGVVPTAFGVAPIRSVFEPEPQILIPAGEGCAFDVLEELAENAGLTLTEYSDGRLHIQAHGDLVLTNLDSDQSIDWKNRWNAWETFDPETNSVRWEASGRLLYSFFPGDQGPSGTVGESGALFAFIGLVELTLDADTGAVTSFSLDGQATDICALLTA